jgi:hypothetical protein
MGAILRKEKFSIELTATAKKVNSASGAQDVLHSKIGERNEALRSGLRSEPLAALARATGELPENERLTMFQQIFDATKALPAASHAVPLKGLAGAIGTLPDGERSAVSQQILNATKSLPVSSQAVPLEGLAGAIPTLQHAERKMLLDRIIDATEKLPPPHCTGLLLKLTPRVRLYILAHDQSVVVDKLFDAFAGALKNLPKSDRAPEFNHLDRIVTRIPWLDYGVAPLGALAGAIGKLQIKDRPAAIRLLYNSTVQLPKGLQDMPLKALARQSPLLPGHGKLAVSLMKFFTRSSA